MSHNWAPYDWHAEQADLVRTRWVVGIYNTALALLSAWIVVYSWLVK